MSNQRSQSPPDPNRKWNFNSNPFSIIGITSEADVTLENVKKKYHLKILSCHPDKQVGIGQRSQSTTATEVTSAYNFLKGKDEPTLKRLFRRFQPSAGNSTSSSSASNWWGASFWAATSANSRRLDLEKCHLPGYQCSQCRSDFFTFPGANEHIKLICGKTHPDAHVLKNGVRLVNYEEKKDETRNASKAEATATSGASSSSKTIK